MAKIGDQVDPDFIISTGDNFYEDGLTGVDDPAFEESFSNIYLGPSLQKQWYNGNFTTQYYIFTRAPYFFIIVR